MHALQSVEVLSIKLVQLTLDPLDRVLDLWDDNELQGVYSSVCNFNHSVDGHELSLQRGNLNEKCKIFLEPIFGLHYCLASSSHADHLIISSVKTSQMESWLLHTSNILGGDLHSHISFGFDRVSHGNTEITCCKVGLSHLKLALIEVFSHSSFCLHNSFHDFIESLLKGIRFFLKQIISLFGTGFLSLKSLKGPKYCEINQGTYILEGTMLDDILNLFNYLQKFAKFHI